MAQHPLEPLSADEFRRTAEILRRDQGLTDSWRFASIELREPPKSDVRSWLPGDPITRTSFAVLWNRADNQTWEGTVDLTGDTVVSWTHVPTRRRTSRSTSTTRSTRRCAARARL